MKPMKLTPAYANYLWGGERLKTEYGKESELTPLAESWEISCHSNGPTTIATGEYKGKTLQETIEAYGKEAMLGVNCNRFPMFPLLVKLIDAKTPLSLQVHPGDEYALKHENSCGKTEMWLVLEAEPESFLYFGVKRPVSRDELKAAIENQTLETLLNRRPVKKGDVLFIPAGELHAIGAGIVVCEVQQNSDLTYRVYDYGRRDAAGSLRELHIDKALKVCNLTPPAEYTPPDEPPLISGGAVRTLLAKCEYFTVRRLSLSGKADFKTYGRSFRASVCVEGEGVLSSMGERLPFKKGESLFIPADTGAYTLSGRCECITVTVPRQR